jgi:hypothetical protein
MGFDKKDIFPYIRLNPRFKRIGYPIKKFDYTVLTYCTNVGKPKVAFFLPFNYILSYIHYILAEKTRITSIGRHCIQNRYPWWAARNAWSSKRHGWPALH